MEIKNNIKEMSEDKKEFERLYKLKAADMKDKNSV